MLKSLSSESVGEIMNTVMSSREETPSTLPAFSYADKKPGSAFSYVLPPKKRLRESLETLLNPESRKNGEVVINIPIDVSKYPNGSITRTLYMSKYRATMALANEVDIFYTDNPNPVAATNLEKNFGPICQHIKNCKMLNCSQCIMSKILKNPDYCHRLMNHTMRCNTNRCPVGVCQVFKNHMMFKFMVYNPPMNIIESRVIQADNNA